METTPPNQPSNSQHISLRLNLRIIVIILLGTIAAMLIIWKPWAKATTGDRTVQVTGDTTIKADPDEFVFYPSYNFKNTDKNAALAALTKKNNEITAKLKTLGVTDKQIKTNATNNDYWYIYSYDPMTGNNNYTLSLTITVDSQDLAQKVEDYLATTSPSGELTPQADFSDAKRKQLENTARDQATQDARRKIDQMAKNLGFKVGKVKSVSDDSGQGVFPLAAGSALDTNKSSNAADRLVIQPGQNDLSYSVSVTYFIR